MEVICHEDSCVVQRRYATRPYQLELSLNHRQLADICIHLRNGKRFGAVFCKFARLAILN